MLHLDRPKGECTQRFATTASDQLTVLEKLMDPVALWDPFNHETLDAARGTTGERPRTRQNFILVLLETLEATDACCVTRLNGN